MGDSLQPAAQRYQFIDGLRGLAAMAVVAHHAFAFAVFHGAFDRGLPHWLHALAVFGHRGVQIFFVVSGFVIAHVLRDAQLSAGAAGNFIARRQLRLNPNYWLCTLLAFARLHAAWAAHPHELARPHLSDLILNSLYLQRITGHPVFLGSSWTLCLEMQLYVVFVLILWLEQLALREPSGSAAGRAPPPVAPPSLRSLAPPIVLCMGLISVWFRAHLTEDMDAWWFTQAWNLFALGVLTCWALCGRCRAASLAVLLIAVVATGAWFHQDGMIVGAATALVIYAAGIRRRLGSWLAWPPLQYLGAISYSLYLVHNEILARADRLGEQLTGDSLASATFWTLLACAASVLIAHALYLVVERPTMRAAAAIKRRRDRRAHHGETGLLLASLVDGPVEGPVAGPRPSSADASRRATWQISQFSDGPPSCRSSTPAFGNLPSARRTAASNAAVASAE